MTYKELKNEITKIAKLRGAKSKSETCQYRGTGQKRYCTITSHTECGRCRFYEPSAEATYELALDAIRAAQDAEINARVELSDVKSFVLVNMAPVSEVAEQLYYSGQYVAAEKVANSLNAITDRVG